ncbi:hypothetical protein MTO96_006385 [Rhipicephalus appendiculatus]
MKQKSGPLQTNKMRYPGANAPNSSKTGPGAKQHYSQAHSQASTSVFAFAPAINITITNGNFIYNSNHFGCGKAARQSTPLSRHKTPDPTTVGTNFTRHPTPKGQSPRHSCSRQEKARQFPNKSDSACNRSEQSLCQPSRQSHRKYTRDH